MDKDEVEDNGVPIETLSEKDILEEIKDRLRQVGNLPTNGITLDPEMTSTSGVVTVGSTVLALLVTSNGGGGVVRVLSKPARYTKTDGLPGEVLLTLKPVETPNEYTRSFANSQANSNATLDPMSDVTLISTDGKALYHGSFNFRFGQEVSYCWSKLIVAGRFVRLLLV
ncbi:hypothetical protein I7I51_07590 [Histoplasma capsulatum]|uniref:Uncharacterized protein n=1 Tax=Ajellomyces capsulatus TaxID=5037 RepID=A0A8A1M1U1_AJECA|nr:hypothetical protein I7I51_07590 [Histoplasma capsulatum]